MVSGFGGTRRVLVALCGAGALLGTASGAAAAQATPGRVCAISDPRLNEISGMVLAGSGYAVVNDSADEAARRKIFFLDRRCAVVRAVSYPSRPRDTEDMARTADGTIWIADIGDNSGTRTTVAVWKLAPGAAAPRLYRLSYPDGTHDAEALLVSPAGTPIIVTKDPGAAGVYVPEKQMRATSTTPLRKAGVFTVPATTTSNPFSLLGRLVVTGGAVSPDGSRVVLRTYADAFEFDVTGGDIVKAITTTEPRIVALPDEPQGESITYSADGTALLTVSETSGQPAGTRPVILRYPLPGRSKASAPAATPAPLASDAPAAGPRDGTPKVITVGALALFLGVAGLVLIRVRRTRAGPRPRD